MYRSDLLAELRRQLGFIDNHHEAAALVTAIMPEMMILEHVEQAAVARLHLLRAGRTDHAAAVAADLRAWLRDNFLNQCQLNGTTKPGSLPDLG